MGRWPSTVTDPGCGQYTSLLTVVGLLQTICSEWPVGGLAREVTEEGEER